MSSKSKISTRSTKVNSKKQSSTSRNNTNKNKNKTNNITSNTNTTTSNRRRETSHYNDYNNNNMDDFSNDYVDNENDYSKVNESTLSPPIKKVKVNCIKKKSIRTIKPLDKDYNTISNSKNKLMVERRTFNNIEENRKIWSNFIVNEHGMEIIYYYKKSNSKDFIESHRKTHVFQFNIVEDHEFYYYYILSYNHYTLNNQPFHEDYPLLKYFIDEKKFIFDMNTIKYKFMNNDKEYLFHTIRCSIYIKLLDIFSQRNTRLYSKYNKSNILLLRSFIKLYFYDSILFKLNTNYLSDKPHSIWSCINSQYHKIIQSSRYKNFKKSIYYYHENNITTQSVNIERGYIFSTEENVDSTINFIPTTPISIERSKETDLSSDYINNQSSKDLLYFIDSIHSNPFTFPSQHVTHSIDHSNIDTISNNNNNNTPSTYNNILSDNSLSSHSLLKDFISTTLEESKFSDMLSLSESELENLFLKFEEDTNRDSLLTSSSNNIENFSIENFKEIHFNDHCNSENLSNTTINRVVDQDKLPSSINEYENYLNFLSEDIMFISELLDSLQSNFNQNEQFLKDCNDTITKENTITNDNRNNSNTSTTIFTPNTINTITNSNQSKRNSSRKFKYLFDESGKCNSFYRENINISITDQSKLRDNDNNNNNSKDNTNDSNNNNDNNIQILNNNSTELYDCDTDESYTSDSEEENDTDSLFHRITNINFNNPSSTNENTASTATTVITPSLLVSNSFNNSNNIISSSNTKKRPTINSIYSKIERTISLYPDEYERLFIIKNRKKLTELVKMYTLMEKIVYENDYTQSISLIINYISKKLDLYKD